MSLDHAAQLLASGDPHRLRTVMASPVTARPMLIALYALNLGIARAAWASAEPMVGEMRLQWWRDALQEIATHQPVRAHPVLQAAAPFLAGDQQAVVLLDGIVEARRWDLWRDPFSDDAALWDHLGATGGALGWLVARLLGAPDHAEAMVRDAARAGALADWFAAVPDLRARGRHPLPDPTPEGVIRLAQAGVAHHRAARMARRCLPATARPALWPYAGSAQRLRRALARPQSVLNPNAPPLGGAPRHVLWAAVVCDLW